MVSLFLAFLMKKVPGFKADHKLNCQFWKKSTYGCVAENPSQDFFGQRPQYSVWFEQVSQSQKSQHSRRHMPPPLRRLQHPLPPRPPPVASVAPLATPTALITTHPLAVNTPKRPYVTVERRRKICVKLSSLLRVYSATLT
jgi:hypothetical protein